MLLRRARGASALLLAAAGVALTAATLLAALTVYSRAVSEAGVRTAVAAADPAELSILVRGSAGSDPARQREWDVELRRAFGGGLGGVPVGISGAEYGAGWAFAGPAGGARPDSSGVAYASVLRLDDLPAHARLTAGRWASPGASPVQITLAEPVARLLGRTAGDRIRLADRRTGRITEVVVAGVWRPGNTGDPYWRLAPEVLTGVRPQSATYGPLVAEPADFGAHFASSASAAWLVHPRLEAATLDELTRVAAAAAAAGTGLPEPRGLDQSRSAETGLPALAARLTRADLVGRSTLVTPALLIIVLAGYALLLMAVLLGEDRRGETALLRARGASRGHLAGLAVREALVVVLPAAVLAPVLGVGLVALASRVPALAAVLELRPRLTASTWVVAAVAAAGCALAVAGPAARRGRGYAAELAARSRPRTRSVVLRAGLDLVLLALAVLSWLQLRQYASPLSATGSGGGLGIDPLIAAAPTLGVVTGAVLTLRLLPPAARLAARLAERVSDSAAVFGAWQAGRRSHAGPMVLVALAVAAGTVSWCLAATSGRSAADQADLRTGADLRVVEAGVPPTDRPAVLAALPGVTAALPGVRADVPLATGGPAAQLVAVDAVTGARVVRLRDDLAGGDPDALWRRLAAARPAPAYATVPRRGTVIATAGVRTTAVIADPTGVQARIPVEPDTGGRFTLTPPPGAWSLAGFLVEAPAAAPGFTVDWRIEGLDVPPAARDWQTADRASTGPVARPRPGALTATYRVPRSGRVDFAVVPATSAPVPVAATPAALAGLRLRTGQSTTLTVSGVRVDVTVVATVAAVPGTEGEPALLADLPSLNDQLLARRGVVPVPREWWLATRPAEHAGAAAAAARLDGVELVDRRALAAAGRDPFGAGARGALFGAALVAVLLAAVGAAVDVQATTRRRSDELAVLHALGASPRLLTRSLLVEQGFLAGIGALAGLLAGVLVAIAMAPLLVLTPAAERPVPVPLADVEWVRAAGTGALLVVLALALTALAGAGLNRRLAAGPLSVGQDR
ncbi:ABC transporter permease [Nucisporomicrobium flavum]|uniref:ABC transporter permease n=1 Tax=Nucisporomicrobium flavum TaxID=2785915 RepID=UPI0018F3B81C|nr:ABC transporter permease [Nucisporomicrobium flavum]